MTRRIEVSGLAAGLVVAGLLLAACGSSGPSASTTTTSSSTTSTTITSGGGLQPTALGAGQCQAGSLSDGSSYGQVAVAAGTQCATAIAVATAAGPAAGSSYTSNGFTCTPTQQGDTSAWTSSWGGTYDTYICVDGSSAVAFNWGQIYTYETTDPVSSTQPLTPAALGAGECQAMKLSDGSTFAQIALSNAACVAVDFVAKGASAAAGSAYTSNGYACTATAEGSSSAWAPAWSGAFYAYVCTFGTQELAFTWGKDYVYK
jgi:hypothetical protein